MKVAYIVSALIHAGPVTVVIQLAKQMVAHGHECKVFYFDENIFELPFPVQKINAYAPINFAHYDIVHAHCMRPNIYLWLYKKLGAKHTICVSTVHSYIKEEFSFGKSKYLNYIYTKLFIKTLKSMDAVITLSYDAKQYYSKWIKKEKIKCCYNGVELSNTELSNAEIRGITIFKQNDILIGTCAALVEIKGIDQIIKALALLPQQYKLLIIGDGDKKNSLQLLAKTLGVNNRIKWAGFRPNADRYLKFVDIYVQTSLSEGFCLALTEAALYAKPIVSTNIPGMKEKYSENEITYYEVGQIKNLAHAITMAQKDKNKPIMAQQKAQQCFSCQNMYNYYMQVYNQFIKNNDFQ